jgi:hypothetical protein
MGLIIQAAWWRRTAETAAVLSLALCVAWWNDAKAGAFIDIAILIGLVATATFAPGARLTWVFLDNGW